MTDLEDNTLYYFAVTTYDEYGESDFSKEISNDSETGHSDETVAVLALGQHLFAQMVSFEGGNTAALRLKRAEYPALMEWGTMQGVTHDWVTIPLAKTYTNPVVTSQKLWGGNPAVAAQEILTPYAVDVYLREEASADPEIDHVIEDISVFVAE